MKKLRTIIFALMQLVAFFPMLIAQTPFIELKPSNYVLTADEMVAKEKILLPNMAESTWTIKINPIEQCLNGYNLTVQLPEWPEAIIFKADGVYSQALDDYYWSGYNSNGSSIQISKTTDGVLGTIWNATTNRYYGVELLSPETSILIKYTPSFLPIGDVCGVEVEEDQINQEFPPLGDPINCVPTHTDIRVLFLFSPAAFARIPSLAAFANGIIGELNTSSMASGLSPTEVSFVSAGVFVLPGFIEDPCSGKTKKALLANQAAKTLRANFFADIVCMIINDVHGPNPPCDASGNAVNNASADEAYCFAEITTALRQFKATHGIGHVIGLGHQRCSNCWNPRCVFNGGSGYARGFRINSTSRTIMADCDGTTRVPRWSADGVPFGGFTTGDEDNDNARKLREKANKVSCFQPDPPLPPQPVTIIGPTTICGGGTRTYTVAGTGSLSQANWSMKTDITLWESVGTGETATITAPTDAKIITLRVTVPGGGSATITIKVVGCRNNNTVENRMDIKPEIEVENLVNVFPNPANDKITITGLQYKNKVTLYDMQGQTIVEKKGAETTFVDIQTLPSGVYMLSISGTTTVKYFKIIKQ